MSRRAPVAGLLTAVALIACGSSDSSSDAADRSPAAPSPSPTASAEATATATPTATAAPAQAGPARLDQVGSFSQPVYVTAPPGDTRALFVVEKGGAIRVVRGGQVLDEPFLDLSGRVSTGSEQGLLSMAFAPDYAKSRRFYVYYTDTAGDTRVVEYRSAGPDRADPDSARLVLHQDQPESNHNGGLVLFGPDDLLYIGLGDGGGGGDLHGPRGNGQNLGTLLGKLLRIDPRRDGRRPYRVPRSNPFVGRSGRDEIYAYGLRNPWRFSFDRLTGDLSIADVGQNAVEEVNFVRRGDGRGANFGWRVWEGRSRFAAGETARRHVPPVLTRTHANGWCSISGGVVVRDPSIDLYGRYLFGDVCKSSVYSTRLRLRQARGGTEEPLAVPSIVSFGEDARGRVYVVSLDGPVYRLAPR